MQSVKALLALLSFLLSFEPTLAAPVGQQHRVIPLASAASRHKDHRAELAVTIWYPAASGAKEADHVIGPPDQPYFRIASFADDAAPAAGAHAVILLSHGFGGSAEIMGWLGAAFAKAGYVVISVDHPGNTDGDMSLVGAVSWWERPRDLIAALRAVERDPQIGPLIDATRVGAAGFSMGGATALALGGAVFDSAHQDAYCARFPADGVCAPPPEQPGVPKNVTTTQGIAMLGLQEEAAHAGEGTALPTLKAVLSIAPNAQVLSAESLRTIHVPTVLVVGSADPVVPSARHAAMAARTVPGAKLVVVPSAMHYSFLATCTDFARQKSDAGACSAAPQQDAAHKAAIEAGLALFRTTLKSK